MTIRSALLDALAEQGEEIAKIQAELRRERKETAKRALGRLTPKQIIHGTVYHVYAVTVGFANWFVIIDKERRETLEFFGTVDPTKSHTTRRSGFANLERGFGLQMVRTLSTGLKLEMLDSGSTVFVSPAFL